MYLLRFDMRAPAFGAPTAELYPAALEMATYAESGPQDEAAAALMAARMPW